MISDTDLKHLRRAVALAEKALATGNPPFGSVLVGADGVVLTEDTTRSMAAIARTIPK